MQIAVLLSEYSVIVDLRTTMCIISMEKLSTENSTLSFFQVPRLAIINIIYIINMTNMIIIIFIIFIYEYLYLITRN